MPTISEIKGGIYTAVSETGRSFKAPSWPRGTSFLSQDEITNNYLDSLIRRGLTDSKKRLGDAWGQDGRGGTRKEHKYTVEQVSELFKTLIEYAEKETTEISFTEAGLSVGVFKRAETILFEKKTNSSL